MAGHITSCVADTTGDDVDCDAPARLRRAKCVRSPVFLARRFGAGWLPAVCRNQSTTLAKHSSAPRTSCRRYARANPPRQRLWMWQLRNGWPGCTQNTALALDN